MIMDGSVVIQRLTERSYWVMLGSHSTTVFVGDKGVLLVDAPIVAPPDKLMGAINVGYPEDAFKLVTGIAPLGACPHRSVESSRRRWCEQDENRDSAAEVYR